MVNTLPDPWNFSNVEQQLFSGDTSQRLEYGTLKEMNQGGPLHGSCLWVTPTGRQVKLPGSYGGPPVWDVVGRRVALPMWQQALFSSPTQRLVVLDTQLHQLIVFRRGFSVLHLQVFEGLVITGADGPAHRPAPVSFNLGTEDIKQVLEL
ncbi:hypothetical protein PK28_01505 [Hymenobacter sp. DG25B]|uniref:hypothetical protein n=1 Tax=Hymenobacter sp. DG25B TaxID=1385664 RepID=UPI00054110DC|nr:hypothetical protein [Hymenobacter sp. DG25B]AIZ62682.1 hypothetical protein PK28_01505 [Hymenobacter sp. DG25B]